MRFAAKFPIIAALLLAVVFPVKAKAPTVVHPMSVTILVPTDYNGPVTPEQAKGVVLNWIADEQSWFISQVGKTFSYTIKIQYSTHPKSYFSTTQDACGNISGSSAWSKFIEDVGWVNPSRNWIIVMGAGGWSAGGTAIANQTDIGWAVIGDFDVDRELGQPSPCDPFMHSMTTAIAVETLHSMYVDSENPLLEIGTPMSRSQKHDLVYKNKSFLLTP